MSKNIVLKSLYDFLDENLDYYITYDSKKSDLVNIKDLVVNSDITYTVPDKIKIIPLYFQGTLFTTPDDLIGRELVIIDEFDVELARDVIVDVDGITKAIEVQNGFDFDILTLYKIIIEQKCVIYMKSPFSVFNAKTRLHNMGQRERYDFYIKVRNDSEKEYVNNVLCDMRDKILGNNCTFPITDEMAILRGYGRVILSSYTEVELMDISADIQFFMVSFTVEYWCEYK